MTIQRTVPLAGAVSAPSADQRTLPLGGALLPAAGGGAGPVIALVSDATPTNGQSITITGTGFGASTGSIGVGGAAQTVTSWGDTSITITVVRGANRYGVALDLVVTTAALVDSSPVNVNLQPDADWGFIILTSIAGSGVLDAVPGLAVGDGVHWDTHGGSVEVFADGTWAYDSGITPGVTAFDVEAWVDGSGWGSMGSQTIASSSLPVGAATETDLSLARSAALVLAVGLASEAGAALASSAVHLRSAGLSDETDTALALSAGGSLAVGAAVETDTAIARPCVQARPIAIAAETDTSFALVVAQAKAAGMAIEVDTAFARAAVLSRSAGLAAETDYALVPGAMGWPDPSDVLFGVTYGPTGVEYTGTLRPISKGVKIDIATGRAVLVLNNRIVRTI